MSHDVYEGSAPYIFISYAHKDKDRVLPIVHSLQSCGFRVWYDVGIEAGTQWTDDIARHLAYCKCAMLFISNASLKSPHCYDEIKEAHDQKKILIPIHLEQVTLPEKVQKLIVTWQAFFLYRYSDDQAILPELTGSKAIASCRGADYSSREAVEAHRKLAVQYFRKAAQQEGHTDSQFELGECYECGEGVDQDHSSAFMWYHLAAEEGCARAQVRLANYYRAGTVVGLDEVKAAKWYLEAAAQGNNDGCVEYGKCCEHGLGVEKNTAEAIRWYRKAAERCHPEGQFLLANLYDSLGMKEDAVFWFQSAALSSSGVAYAADMMLRLSGILSADTPKPWEAAEEYWEKCQSCYQEGNDAQAIVFLRKAAELGHAQAQCELGMCCYQGDGVARDVDEAVRWFRRAAQHGHGGGALNLGNCYSNGDGVEQNDITAAIWYLEAAHRGHTGAQFNLANCYRDGIGVEKSVNAAIAWFLYSLREHGELAVGILASLGVEL